MLYDGDRIVLRSNDKGLELLYISGFPLREPIAWRGSIVMNTQEELRVAYEELANDTFIRLRR